MDTSKQNSLQQAKQLSQDGRFDEAVHLYQEALQQDPQNQEALLALGRLLYQQRYFRDAAICFNRLMSLNSENTDALIGYAKAQRELGNDFEYLNSEGCARYLQGDYAAALEDFQQALTRMNNAKQNLQNTAISIQLNLIRAYSAMQHYDKAAELCEQVLKHDPVNAVAKILYIQVLNLLGRHAECLPYAETLVSTDNNNAALLLPVIQDLRLAKQYKVAQKLCNLVLKILPNDLTAQTQAVKLHKALLEYDEAIKLAHKILSKNPENCEVLLLLAQLQTLLAHHGQAKHTVEKILLIKPDYANAVLLHSHLLLAEGVMPQGWQEYEIRFKASVAGLPLPNVAQPRWQGEPLSGKRLLVRHEQGCGDAIQFIRYVKRIPKAGGKIIVEVLPDLARLFHCIPEIDEFVEFQKPSPEFDVQIPLGSLPTVFSTDLSTIPQSKGCFQLPDLEEYKISKFGVTKKPRVAVVWRGRAENPRDFQRSIEWDKFKNVLATKEAHFYSLQHPLDKAQRKALQQQGITDLKSHCKDFYDTAQYLRQMDLVITVDTAVAHLAGALQVPTWLLLDYAPDWRWMLDQEDSPWYPTMRLFRQSELDQWEPVLKRVAKELTRWAKKH